MVGSLIGAGLSVLGGVAGGIANRKAADRAAQMREKEKRDNENWYNRRYNEDATQRADAQRLLQLTEENIKRRNKAAAGTHAVMGGSGANVAATKDANNEVLGDAVSRIAAQGEARKDAIEESYRNRKAAIAGEEYNAQLQKGANIAGAIQGVAGAAGSIAGALGDVQWKKPKEGTVAK